MTIRLKGGGIELISMATGYSGILTTITFSTSLELQEKIKKQNVNIKHLINI